MTLVAVPPPQHLSYSQLTSFTYCGEQSRLAKVFHAPEEPSWWLPGGSAVHTVTEMMDRAAHGQPVTVPTFAEAFQAEIDEMVEKTGTPESEFRAGGRKSAQWPGKENKDWWLFEGPQMVQRWRRFTDSVPWDLHEVPAPGWAMDKAMRPAIELELDIQVPNGTIKAFLDRAFRMRSTGELVVVDLKSGNEPASPDQLGLYKVGLEQAFGEPVRWGFYWMARTGVTSEPFDLSEFTQERIDWEFETFRLARDNGLYLPNPGKQCGYCSLRPYCYVQRGELSHLVPRPWEDGGLLERTDPS